MSVAYIKGVVAKKFDLRQTNTIFLIASYFEYPIQKYKKQFNLYFMNFSLC